MAPRRLHREAHPTHGWSLRLPLWLPASPLAVFAVLTARPWLRGPTHRLRLHLGLWLTCGDDLAGHTAASQPCPECGTAQITPTDPRA